MMKNILLVVWGDIHYGGVQLLLLNLLSHMNCENLQIDLYCFGGVSSTALYEQFSALGLHIISGNHADFNAKKVARDLRELMQKKHYDVVHCNTGGLSLTAVTMAVAWRRRVPVRIAHSHNAKQHNAPYAKREKIYQKLNCMLSTVQLACSREAAQHLFGGKGAEKCSILKNGIEVADYQFNSEIRQKIRRELGFENALVIGHVGRFERQKNHEFLMRVFAEVKKQRQDAVLLLIGEGSLMNDIREQIAQLGLTDAVRFLGTTNCVTNYLQAMDVFVFPSRFEGLGIVAIEAQAADLPTICADTVPKEAAVTSRFHSLPLNAEEKEWSDNILSFLYHSPERTNRLAELRAAGYDISQSAEQLLQIYMKS